MFWNIQFLINVYFMDSEDELHWCEDVLGYLKFS